MDKIDDEGGDDENQPDNENELEESDTEIEPTVVDTLDDIKRHYDIESVVEMSLVNCSRWLFYREGRHIGEVRQFNKFTIVVSKVFATSVVTGDHVLYGCRITTPNLPSWRVPTGYARARLGKSTRLVTATKPRC